jgi:hypothetical protein
MRSLFDAGAKRNLEYGGPPISCPRPGKLELKATHSEVKAWRYIEHVVSRSQPNCYISIVKPPT